MSRWYVYDEDTQKGPYGIDELLAYLDSRDRARVHVWRSGFETWLLARDVPELKRDRRPPLSLPGISDAPLAAIGTAGEERPRPRRDRYRWAGHGALVGLAVCALDYGLEWRGPMFEEWDEPDGLVYNLAYVATTAGPLAAIGFVLGLIRDRSNRDRGVTSAIEPAAARQNRRFDNVFARHWRGELPLWISYWVFGFVGNLATRLVPGAATAAFKATDGYDPLRIFAAVATTWLGVLLVTLWQVVGVWRSATRHADMRERMDKSSTWGGLAKLGVVLGVLSLVGTFGRDGLPQIGETYRIAFQDDPGIPPYSIRVMRNGTEAEIVGGFKYGLTSDFAKILNASRQIKVVHLDSDGGRLGEGEKLFRLIRERGLITYVSSKCMSACTLAFAGGRERYVLANASLGFHQGAFLGVREDAFDSIQRDVFRAAGFDSRFIDRALSTPHDDIWQPTVQVLLEAKVITGVADGARFSVSGFGGDLTRDETADMLSKTLPALRSMRTRFSKRYDAIIDEYYESILQGRTQAATIERLRRQLMPFIQSVLPLADDDVLVDFNALLIEQYTALNAKNPSSCWAYASGEDAQANYSSDLPRALIRRELEIQERIVATAVERPEANSSAVAALWDKVQKGLSAKGMTEDRIVLLQVENLEAARHADYCAMSILFFGEIGKLPRQDAATLMREVFAER